MPLRGVQWVPPAVWKKAVDGLHKPYPREHPRPLVWAPCCSLVGPVAGLVTSGLPWSLPFLCAPCYPHASCQLLVQGCLCCCPLAGPSWWPLIRTSGVAAREPPEAELKPTAQLLPLENPKEEEVAVQAPMAVSSSSASSSEDEDLENELEMGPPQRLLVDSTVNTDPILLEKSPGKQGGLCQPEWRYWRRNGPEPHPGKPGRSFLRVGLRPLPPVPSATPSLQGVGVVPLRNLILVSAVMETGSNTGGVVILKGGCDKREVVGFID